MGTSIKLHNKTLDKTVSLLSPDEQAADIELKLPNKNGVLATVEEMKDSVNEQKVVDIINKTISSPPSTEGGSTTVNNNAYYYRGERIIRVFATDKTITVGAKGEFSSLGAALEEASYWKPAYGSKLDYSVIPNTITGVKNPENYKVVHGRSPILFIKILAGTKLSERINIFGQDLSYVMIISEDAEVPVDNAKIMSYKFNGQLNQYFQPTQASGAYAFISIEKCLSPLFNCVFAIDKAYAKKTHTNKVVYSDYAGIANGIACHESQISFGNRGGMKGFTNGLYAENSRVSASGAKFTNNAYGLHIDNGSSYNLRLTSHVNDLVAICIESCNMGEIVGCVGTKGTNVNSAGKAYFCFFYRPNVCYFGPGTLKGYAEDEKVSYNKAWIGKAYIFNNSDWTFS